MRTRWRPRRDRSAGPPRCTARGGVQKWAYPGFVDSGAEPGPGPWGGVRLTHPVAQRLMGDAEVLRHTLDRLAARSRQTHRPRPEFARASGHRPRHADHRPSAGVFQPRTVRITGIASFIRQPTALGEGKPEAQGSAAQAAPPAPPHDGLWRDGQSAAWRLSPGFRAPEGQGWGPMGMGQRPRAGPTLLGCVAAGVGPGAGTDLRRACRAEAQDGGRGRSSSIPGLAAPGAGIHAPSRPIRCAASSSRASGQVSEIRK